MKKIGERKHQVVAVREFPLEEHPKVVIKTQNYTYTFIYKRKEKCFEMYAGNLFIGHIYKDIHYSAYPLKLDE